MHSSGGGVSIDGLQSKAVELLYILTTMMMIISVYVYLQVCAYRCDVVERSERGV